MDNENKYWETSDIYVASTLSVFVPLDSIDKTNPAKATFVFKNSDWIQEFLDKYWSGKIQVEPKSLFYCMKSIKSRLYSQ